ncbi:hypothetical protein BEL04_16985 [Mucilaginibacter sp. PPCGB 2223]|uniref:GNAT family N-acetyltransferase n=1 Tax=Mucilaginibacter sp. PPCGB 2223 TaxID=1886027 RepID=UPI00082416B9|nr:GNAT family N-acetyltransferase [Mucilaginibacter sp. PPCGB 2223]OCX51710.1 hypothetical protein BEL04_16985 [Mucilaginibacter sp. PPCGB 2223]
MSFARQIEIKQLSTTDLDLTQQLFILLQQVFGAEHPIKVSKTYTQRLLANPVFVAFAAIVYGELAGGLTGYISPMYNGEISELYIYDIAVKPEFQRRGIGKQLIAFTKDYCSKSGMSAMYVQANAEDEHALDFYRSSGGREHKVVHFTYTL